MTKKRLQPKTKFPVDPNVFEVPHGVFDSELAHHIVWRCTDLKIDIPKELCGFVKKHDLDAGWEWQQEMLKLSETMPLETLLKWVDTFMPRGLCRAEMRAVAKRRIEERDNKGEVK